MAIRASSSSSPRPSRGFLLILGILFLGLVACDEKGAVHSPAGADLSYLMPSLSSLQVTGNSINKNTGGILTLACTWSSPETVTTATAYLGYSKTLSDNPNGPTGVLASGTSSGTASLSASLLAGFVTQFASPLMIPTAVSSTKLTGYWYVEIPFPASSITDAPVGKSQMQLWMLLNGKKTNTLAFELTFTNATSTSSRVK